MKTVQLFMELTVSDEYFENEMMSLKNDILSGKFQRETKKHAVKNGVKKCKATFNELKTTKFSNYDTSNYFSNKTNGNG